ncbi:Uncharacterised protein [Mycobacteroides abscessus subsp. massiliense]|nr:Uncharacterised protein [Mycobacteroides abscessus subsp. massiliense]
MLILSQSDRNTEGMSAWLTNSTGNASGSIATGACGLSVRNATR